MPAEEIYLAHLNLSKNELRLAVIQNLGTAPSSPAEGQIYHNTTDHKTYRYDGTAWKSMDESASPGAGSITSAMIADGTIVNADIAVGAAIALAKLATDPLARANHTGTQAAATVSDFDAQVRASRLDQMAVPTADVSLDSHRLTNVTDPTSAQDAATKAYVDARAAGLDPHDSVVAATTAALSAATYANGSSGVGATLTGNSNGALADQDGVTLTSGKRLLVKDQAAGLQNGIYSVTQVGSGGTPFILTRVTDLDQAAEFVGGAFVFVEQGTVNGSGGFVLQGSGPWTVGTTAVAFVQFTGAGEITAGTGLTKAGNTLSVTQPFGKYAVDVGDGASTSITVTHNLNTKDVVVELYDKSTPFARVRCEVDHATVNTVTLGFTVAPTSAQYRCVVLG